MRLKTYQIEALETLSRYLKLLSDAEDKVAKAKEALAKLPEELRDSVAAPKEAAIAAWDAARDAGMQTALCVRGEAPPEAASGKYFVVRSFNTICRWEHRRRLTN